MIGGNIICIVYEIHESNLKNTQLPGGEGPECSRLDAVGGPGGVPEVVADTDAEPAIVGPHDADAGALLAANRHATALATILRPALRT